MPDQALLSKLEGRWEGPTRTWFEPDQLADESTWRGTIRPVLGGRFVVHEYAGTLGGEPLEGLAVYGIDPESERATAAWADTFHMGHAIMHAEGRRTAHGFSVLGSYDAGEGPRWGWRTELELRDRELLVITMYNIPPGGAESKAVETIYTRRT